MPNYDVRYRYTDTTGAVYAAKTVVDAVSGDNAVSLAAANLATRLPTNVWEIVGVAPSVAFGDTQDDVGAVRGYSPSAISIGNADAVRAVAVATPVNFIEAVQGATGSPGRVQLRAAGSDANIALVLTPKGTGALIAQAPDSATAGGNARGANAVDLQTSRGAATQVASGNGAVIGGGVSNTSSAIRSTVAGGETCAATANNATIGGGISNTASGGAATVAGGNTNIASGTSAAVAGGQTNTAGGTRSWIPGGGFATTRGIFARGAWGGSGFSGAAGEAQAGEYVLLRQTTDATQTRLTSDNAAASTTNQIVLPNFSSYGGVLRVVAKAQGSTDAAVWVINCGAVRGNGVGTVVVLNGGASIAPTFSNGASAANWRLAITADTTNGALAVDGTGAAVTTINWAGRFANVEVVTIS